MKKYFRRSTIALLVLAGVAFLVSPLFANWQRNFKEKFSSKNSWERHEAVAGLNPDDSTQLSLLFRILKMNDWYLRKAAWKTLSRASSDSSLKKMKRELGRSSSSRYRIREGIILAMGIKKDRSFIPEIIECLDDRSWPVVRSAAQTLAKMPDKRSVGPMIKAWKKNKRKLRVWVNIRKALETITKRYIGNDVKNWEKWWSVNKDHFKVGSTDPEAEKKAEESGNKSKRTSTVLKGVKLDYSTRGKGRPLFVLPDYGYNEKYVAPYLAPLEKSVKIFYIKLPPINSFKDRKQSAGMTVYPLEQLVDAFDALRKKYKQKKVAILGHGVTAWVAMKYASKYPKRVSHLIIVSSFSGQQAFRRGVELLERTGKQKDDAEMEHFAQSLQIMPSGQPKYSPKSMAERKALQRKEWTLRFADQGDAVLGRLFKKAYSPDAQAVVPQFELRQEPKRNVPALVIFGKHSLFTSLADGRKIAKHYGRNSSFIVFRRSRRTPFIEENRRFIRYMESFFRRY